MDIHYISHQEALCCKSLKIHHVMQVVVRKVNFVRTKGLNHCQFYSLLSDKAFFDLHGEIENFMC